MSENRFQEQTPESLSLWPIMTVHCSLENGFVLIPCPGMDASPVIGIYQLAYESAGMKCWLVNVPSGCTSR